MTRLVVRRGARELDGVIRPGESWLAAARHTGASLRAEPVPLDLSGDAKVFAVEVTPAVSLRPMTRDDLPASIRWRSSPAVRRWWNPSELDADAIGVDYAIGEDGWRGRGLGVRLLWAWAWALRARHRFADATTYFAAPDHRNAASLRILAKAGFEPGETVEEPQDDGRVDTVVAHRLDVRRVLGSA